MLIKELEEQEELESDKEEQKTFIQSAAKFGAKTLPVKEPKALDEE